MNVFHWDRSLETGISKIDEQHQFLVELINRFGNLLSLDRINSADLDAVFNELKSYAQRHFEEEEAFMTISGIAPQHIGQHKEEHASFVQEVTLMHDELTLGKEMSERHLFEYLVNWLIFHILGSDMCMVRQRTAILNHVSAQEALAAEHQSEDRSRNLLLTSLKTLFSQVSRRNRQLIRLNQTLEEKVEERTLELSRANRRLGELASTDALTGVANRHFAMQTLSQLWDSNQKEHSGLACLMVDADHFKEVNDTYGHDAGDTVLCELAKQLTFSVRTDDIVCRMGGDEFLIILPDTDREGALQIARHICTQVSEMRVQVIGGVWRGSVSVGVGYVTSEMTSLKDLIKSADCAVYAAKADGKNCVRECA